MAVFRPVCIAIAAGMVSLLGPGSVARAADLPNLVGTWNWSWTDRNGQKHHHVLEVEGADPTRLAAREVFDDQPPVRVEGLAQDGKTVRFTVHRGEQTAKYQGVLEGANTLRGKVTVTQGQGQTGPETQYDWNATRQTKPKLPPGPAPTKPEG